MMKFAAVPNDQCNVVCPNFKAELCGGEATGTGDGYWNVYIEYDMQHLGSHGTYDPWRYMWYSIVVIRTSTIMGGMIGQGQHPER
jgi:hypothetical protein